MRERGTSVEVIWMKEEEELEVGEEERVMLLKSSDIGSWAKNGFWVKGV